ncbi:hypothetical protein L226DRAFT_611012 [Lentinus tigrinus ALCF2SS1-7]|uniref:Oxidoreductase AflY n=1 Tax=Lentinus tigrinus ALCF2SS1-6 TaxID=1328759 RepID=A0A5C2SGW7_9APHY|nr:hypothetical protein L227DRAFT_544964 [Lentinus tigrinus ALCF2SS1-6]RPD77806.1 hypothetical protein L226DRAFT_611012 [Lentinus tigrinus ALCF2SS1-7]
MSGSGPKLSSRIRQGILNLSGTTFETKSTAERLLEEDRQEHHCFHGRVGFHNHLSHHLLAAYDLGASASLLQKIYDVEVEDQSNIQVFERKEGKKESVNENITVQNWTKFFGDERYYASYVNFFTQEISTRGVGEVLEQFVFAPGANGNGAYMLLRFVGGALHPLIQTGYGAEFGSDAMVAQALAQTAVHSAFWPEIFDLEKPPPSLDTMTHSANAAHRHPSKGHSLLSILRQAYDSDIMKPVMPYDPDALLSARFKAACTDGRPAEIRRLSALWEIDVSRGQAELDEKVEELLWTATLLLAGTGKRGRKPRLDFFLMHMLTAALFVPSLLTAVPSLEFKATLLRAFVPVILMYLTVRGRPRIDPGLLMSYSAFPQPPSAGSPPLPDASSVGDPRSAADASSWPAIVASVLHAPDAHTVKAVRSLYYAAQRYGRTPPGGAIGAFDAEGGETHEGMAQVDGTIFVRAAGVVMDTLGWVSHGQKAGSWDRSALGWDDAWKSED